MMNNEEKILHILENIQTDVSGLKTDVAGLKSDIVEVKADVAGLKSDMVEVKADIAGLKSDMVEVKADIAGLKTDVAGLKTDLTEVKHRVVLIENEHGKSLGALHDGYTMLYGVSCEIRSDIKNILDTQEKHDLEITVLKSMAVA